MSKVAVEHFFNGPTTNVYDSSKTFLGTFCTQVTGTVLSDCYAGPHGIALARPGEGAIAVTAGFPHVISEPGGRVGIAWVFLVSQVAAAVTRQIVMYEHDTKNNILIGVGKVNPTVSNSGNITVRGFRMTYDTYSTGVVSGASGQAVISGVGTLFRTDLIAQGARIGFGTTVPASIGTWYTITGIASDTSLTVTPNLVNTWPASSEYVIEELRAIMACTNATAASGGLRIVKGLNYSDFSTNNAVSMAASGDHRQAAYWLCDILNVPQNQTSIGMALEEKIDNKTHYCYVFDGTTNTRIFKYNVRAPLGTGYNAVIPAGRSASAFILATSGITNTGTASQVNNGRFGTHSIYSNYLWYTTTTRVYGISATSLVASALPSRLEMTEVPPGGTASFAITNTINNIELASQSDEIIVLTTLRGYTGTFNTISGPFSNIFAPETRQYDQSTADSQIIPTIQTGTSTTNSLFVANGWGYFCRSTATTTNNQLLVWPFSANYTYQSSAYTKGRVITPSIATPNCQRYYRVYVNDSFYGTQGSVIAKRGEGYYLYYRTAGIADNSGIWSLVPQSGNLIGVIGAAAIQFMFEFVTIGETCLPAKINSLTVLYETSEYLPAHLEWNFTDSNSASGIVGFSQISAYGSVPNLTINYYRSDNDANVLTQGSSGNTNGLFQYWNGSSWLSALGSALGPDAVGTRRRFVPTAGLPSGTNLYTKLQVS